MRTLLLRVPPTVRRALAGALAAVAVGGTLVAAPATASAPHLPERWGFAYVHTPTVAPGTMLDPRYQAGSWMLSDPSRYATVTGSNGRYRVTFPLIGGPGVAHVTAISNDARWCQIFYNAPTPPPAATSTSTCGASCPAASRSRRGSRSPTSPTTARRPTRTTRTRTSPRTSWAARQAVQPDRRDQCGRPSGHRHLPGGPPRPGQRHSGRQRPGHRRTPQQPAPLQRRRVVPEGRRHRRLRAVCRRDSAVRRTAGSTSPTTGGVRCSAPSTRRPTWRTCGPGGSGPRPTTTPPGPATTWASSASVRTACGSRGWSARRITCR